MVELHRSVESEVPRRRAFVKLAGVAAAGTAIGLMPGDPASAAPVTGLDLDHESSGLSDTVQVRRAVALDWSSRSVLQDGEIGMEIGTGRIKVGNGVGTWDELLYVEDTSLTNYINQAVGIDDYLSYAELQLLTTSATWNESANVVATGQSSGLTLTLPEWDFAVIAPNTTLAPRLEIYQFDQGRISLVAGSNATIMSSVLTDESELASVESRPPLTGLRTRHQGSLAVARAVVDYYGTTVWHVSGDVEVH